MKLYEEFEIDGSFKFDGVQKNMQIWYENKAPHIRAMRKHPNWCEEAKAIIFTQTETRAVNYAEACCALSDLIGYISDNYSVDGYHDLPCIIYSTLRGMTLCKYKQSSFITKEFLDEFAKYIYSNTEVPKRIGQLLKEGTKITKLVHKCYEMLKLEDGRVVDVTHHTDLHENGDRNYRSFDKYFAKFADCMSELTVERITVISANFLDFMTMSNGNSWSSCHFINSHNIFHNRDSSSYEGLYKQGCLSYALDEPSFLLFTLPSSFKGTDYYRCQKLTRMCCQYKDGVLITGKLYPNNEDELITRYRQTLQKVMAEIYEFDNLWTFSKNTSRIEAFVETNSGATHYADYLYEKQKPTVSLCRINFALDLDKPMKIGHEGYCLHCGEEIGGDHNWLQCRRHRKKPICSCCGCRKDDVGELHEIDGYLYCDDCAFYCEHHKRFEVENDRVTIETHNGRITICRKSLRCYTRCEHCGVFVKNYDIHINGDKHCPRCGVVFQCDISKLPLIYADSYHIGDYVLMKKDVTCCDYNTCGNMREYYPERIVKIIDMDSDGTIYVSNLDRRNWSWSANCFEGIVVGATDEMIGEKYNEIC
jgi:hypothetical protein